MAESLLHEAFEHFNAHRLAEAEAAVRAVLKESPEQANAWRLYGLIAMQFGKKEFALEALRRAVELRPDVAEFHYSLGNGLRLMGRMRAAVIEYRQALELQPDYSDVLINLGIALDTQGAKEEAREAWESALRLNPRDVEALSNLSGLYRSIGNTGRAMELVRQAIEVKPQAPETPYLHSSLIVTMAYDDRVTPEEGFAEARRWNERYAAPPAREARAHQNDRRTERRLRVGYVSGDLREHAVSFFVEPILAQHDAEQVEVFVYSSGEADAVTKRLQSYGHTWRDIRDKSDAEAEEMVRGDGIDILVELACHTGKHRLLMMSRKPAPVQVTYLGYAGTTGLDAIDWRITDPIVDPVGMTEGLHSEKLMRLPRTQWCYAPPHGAPDVRELPCEGTGRITFGSATHFAKLTGTAMDLWAEIVRSVPGSRLAFKAWALGDAQAKRGLRKAFAERGVEEERVLLEPGSGFASYLGFLGGLDVALDTFPFGGGTTTCHLLWMGTPVVTMTGKTSVSRVGASILRNVGLEELVTGSADEFVKTAVTLARDKEKLRELRAGMRPRMRASALCDAEGFIRDLENAYRQMWREWCASGAGT